MHPAPDLAAVEVALREHAAPVAAAARARGRAFGLGAWWPMSLAGQLLADRTQRERLAALLQELDLPLWTLNVFPHGGFHDTVVKTAVYEPDWANEDRLVYSRTCAEVGAALVPRGTVLPLWSICHWGIARRGRRRRTSRGGRAIWRAARVRSRPLRPALGCAACLPSSPSPIACWRPRRAGVPRAVAV